MNDIAKRVLRTFAQGFVGILVLLALPMFNGLISAAAGGGEIAVDLNVWRTILFVAIAGGAVAVIALAQNLLEDKAGVQVMPK